MPIGKVGISRKLVWSSEIETARREVNDWLATQTGKGISFLDLEPLLSINHTLDPAISRDTLHLTDKGYRRLNKALATSIQLA